MGRSVGTSVMKFAPRVESNATAKTFRPKSSQHPNLISFPSTEGRTAALMTGEAEARDRCGEPETAPTGRRGARREELPHRLAGRDRARCGEGEIELGAWWAHLSSTSRLPVDAGRDMAEGRGHGTAGDIQKAGEPATRQRPERPLFIPRRN
jgi:hypothetical protein